MYIAVFTQNVKALNVLLCADVPSRNFSVTPNKEVKIEVGVEYVVEFGHETHPHRFNSHLPGKPEVVSNKVDIARFRLQALRYATVFHLTDI